MSDALPADAPAVPPADPALVSDLARVFERHAARDWTAVVRLGRRTEGPLGGIGLLHARFAVLKAMSFAAGELGQMDTALESADGMVRLAARLAEDPGAPAEAAVTLAIALHRMGDTDVAWSLLDTAAALPDVPPRMRMRALNTLAATLIADVQQCRDLDPVDALLARTERARRAAEQAWALAADLADDRHRATTLVNLGASLGYLDRREEGLRLLERAWALSGAGNAWPHLHLVAETCLLDGRPWAALDRCRDAIASEHDATPRHTRERNRDVAWRAARELSLHEQSLAHLTALERLRRGQTLRRRAAMSRLAGLRHDALAAFDHLHRERLLAHEAARQAAVSAFTSGDDRVDTVAPQVAGVLADHASRHRPSLVAVVALARPDAGGAWTPVHREVLRRELGRTCRVTDRLLPHRAHGIALVYVGVGPAQAGIVRTRIAEAVDRAAAALGEPALAASVEVGLAVAPPAHALRRAERNLREQRQGGGPVCVGGDTPADATGAPADAPDSLCEPAGTVLAALDGAAWRPA